MSASVNRVGMAALMIVVGFSGLLRPGAAHAQAAAPDETILLVGVTRGQRSDARLARTLEDHLRLGGELLTPSLHLTPAERLCGDGECLEQLAKREHAVLAMTVNIRDSGSQSYFLTLALVDAQRRLPVQSEAVCDACSADELTTRLNDLSDRTLHLYRQRLQTPAGASTTAGGEPVWGKSVGGPNQESSPGATPHPGGFAQLPTPRKIIAGVLGAAALGVLIPSIFWSVKDGQPAPPPCSDDPLAAQDCRYDNRALYGVGYALTAALTGGVLLTLFLPGQAANSRAATASEKAP